MEKPTPPGECPQCWQHAYDRKRAHAHLAPGEQCPDCLAHLELHKREKKVRWW
jgi:predicted amidophosphoribosyltransferase